MGMYDYLKVSIEKLPISKFEKEKYGHRFNFQTKDWDCKLATLEITEDGLLQYHNFDYSWEGEEVNILGTKGGLVEKNNRIELVAIQGYINFYDTVDGEWFEFEAKFTDGKLQEIVRVP